MKQFYMQLSALWGYPILRGFTKSKGLLLVLALMCFALTVQAQQVYNFTNCGATGRLGPIQSQVNATYVAGNTLYNKVAINTQGIQEWIVPATGDYEIEAWGAGVTNANGAKLKGKFRLTAGQKIFIAVGQQAMTSGGNGGTFVATGTSLITSTPLIIAGGGGSTWGGNLYSANQHANFGTSGQPGSTGFGGTNGNGGQTNTNNSYYGGGGGGGFFTDGTNTSAYGVVGQAFVNGAKGGDETLAQNASIDGGFGGGGAGYPFAEPAGGGGYSGGGGGGYTGSSNTGLGNSRWGGGGGSFNSGLLPVNIAVNNIGNGSVIITNLYSVTIEETKSIACAGDATGELSATASGGTEPYTYSWSPAGGTAAVASNLTVGTYIVTVTDAVGNTTTATKEIKANDTEAPVIVKSGTKVLSIPAGENRDGSIYTHYFTDPLPAGTVVTGVTLEYSGRDQGWGGTGAWARIVVSDTQIGSNQFFGYSQNFRIEYKGVIPGYVYGGNNHMKMFYNSGWGWVGYFQGGTMTIHYETLADVKGECTATVTTVPVANDNCAGAVTGTTTDPLTYSTQGTHVITWKFDDGNGNVSTASQNVIIQDINAPTALAKNITVQLDATGAATITPAMVDNGSSDICSAVTLALSKTAFDCSNLGTSTVTLTVTDAAGNVATTTATITVEDKIAPVAKTQNITVQLDATGNATITAAQVNNGSSDNCGIETIALSKTAFGCSNVGENTVTLTVTDKSGNTHEATAIVTVLDETLPVAIAKNITVQLDANGVATITATDINNGSSDACGIASMSLSKATFDCANVGDNSITLTVTDNNGNVATATAIVKVEDKVIPIAKAQNVTIELDANGVATITAAAVDNGSSDACGAVTLDLSKTTFDCSNVGANTVTLTVTDAVGNESTTTATVTVVDNIAPVALAKNITVQLDATGSATITAAQVNNGSSDNCSIKTISLDKTTFDCSQVGENEVVLTVTDVNNNTHTTTAIVTVEDKVAPVAITQNITVQLDAAGNATITADDINNGSSDACGIKSMILSKTAFDCSTIGANTVTLTVTDNNGNVSTKTAIVTVEDKIAPIALTKNITIKLDAAGKATIVAADVDNGSSDVCGSVTLTIDKAAFDCSNIGENEVILTVTDAYDNVATEKATVTVVDDLVPVVLIQNITVKLDANGTATITTSQIDNGTSDNCGIANIALDVTDFTCENVGLNTVILTVTDVNGNVAKKEATVTVVDEIAPTAIAKNITAELDANGTVTITAAQVNDNSTDNCGIETLTLDTDTFGCSNLGENTVNLTVTDKAGNTAIVAAIVTIVDNIAPTITAPADLVLDVDAGKTTASNVNLGTPVTADNCDAAAIVVKNDAPTEYPAGTTIVTWTATDSSGNKTTATQTVTVRQDIASVATLATINVPIRTAYANVPLPATVEVTYTNGQKEAIGVTWAQGTYNGLVAGTYVLTGQLIPAPNTTNQSSKVATISVVVEPNKVPTALAFSATTFAPNAQAEDVIGTLTTTDPDDTQFVYTLVAGEGAADNSLFMISGDKVYLKSNNGLSGKTTFTIRVRSTDPYQNTIEKAFTLTKGNYGVAVDKLKIVNAFSPNGDGINDNWTIPELRFYNNVEIEVFDRSGVRLFHTTDPEMAWDGRSSNGQILKGAFFYIVQVKDINLVKKGVVTILKK